jgi:hypothetical protein
MKKLLGLMVLIPLGGCASTMADYNQNNVAQVPVMMAALKCAFAEAALKDQQRREYPRFSNSVASGTLTLNLVHTLQQGGKISTSGGATGPLVFAFSGVPVSILPNFSNTVTKTDTIKTVISFRFLMAAHNTKVCGNLPADSRAKFGLSEWLSGVINGLDVNARFDPPGQLDKLDYSADFGVVNAVGGGVDFDFVFLKAGVAASDTRNDVQSISFAIAPISKENPAPANTGLGPTFVKPIRKNPVLRPTKPGIGPASPPLLDR